MTFIASAQNEVNRRIGMVRVAFAVLDYADMNSWKCTEVAMPIAISKPSALFTESADEDSS